MVLDRRIRGQCFLEMFGAKNQTGRSKYDIDYILSLFLEKRSMKRSLVLDLSRLKKYGNSQKYLMSLILKRSWLSEWLQNSISKLAYLLMKHIGIYLKMNLICQRMAFSAIA